MEYCTDDDMLGVRPDILSLGVSDWDDQIEEAGKQIDRALDSRWYRQTALTFGVAFRETPFDRAKLLNMSEQLTRLGTYAALKQAYLFLMKNQVDDAFEKQYNIFSKLYGGELEDVLKAGIDYDFDSDKAITAAERDLEQPRRLVRG